MLEKQKNEAELTINHLDTKNRLLKEALNKRNEDIKSLENGNEDLINLLEKCDDKIQKLDEDYRIEKMKAEKYEQELQKANMKDRKIDVESLDGRINFLVNTLEEYRRILEEDSAFNEPSMSEENGAINEYMTPLRLSSRSMDNNALRIDNANTLNTGTLSSDYQDVTETDKTK